MKKTQIRSFGFVWTIDIQLAVSLSACQSRCQSVWLLRNTEERRCIYFITYFSVLNWSPANSPLKLLTKCCVCYSWVTHIGWFWLGRRCWLIIYNCSSDGSSSCQVYRIIIAFYIEHVIICIVTAYSGTCMVDIYLNRLKNCM